MEFTHRWLQTLSFRWEQTTPFSIEDIKNKDCAVNSDQPIQTC